MSDQRWVMATAQCASLYDSTYLVGELGLCEHNCIVPAPPLFHTLRNEHPKAPHGDYLSGTVDQTTVVSWRQVIEEPNVDAAARAN